MYALVRNLFIIFFMWVLKQAAPKLYASGERKKLYTEKKALSVLVVIVQYC